MPRFSKATLAAFVFKRTEALEKEHKFDSQDGYAQVRGKGEEKNRAYGEFNMLLDLADEFELEPPPMKEVP